MTSTSTDKQIPNADGKGWLNVRWDAGGTFPPLPQFLRVTLQRTEDGRDYFKVNEGKKKDETGSVTLKEDGSSYLVDPVAPTSFAATVKFKRTTNQLWYGDSGPIDAVTDPDNKVPLGTFDLEIPYEVHSGGASYEDRSIFAKTWFRIGHSGDRFLHPGSVSAGCITVTDIPKWNDIYNYLINARKGDGKSVAVVEVID
jgi:hypothetical protein